MKKKLESELMSIAHRILKLSGKDDLNAMHKEVAALYEKLTVLKFAKDNFNEEMPTVGGDSSFFEMLNTAFNNKVSDTIEVEDKVYVNLDEPEDDGIMEPVIHKIKDMVAEMPEEGESIEGLLEDMGIKEEAVKNDVKHIANDYSIIPEFEPVEEAKAREEKQNLSLNDKLKANALHIDLNDKIAFIKHIFGGQTIDYERVISQLNTAETFDSAKYFILEMVKPDYNNWEGKEEYETRFLDIVERKFLKV